MLSTTLLFAQKDSVPVNRSLKDKPVPNYPDSNSIYKSPDTNAIYNEEQGYPDKKTENSTLSQDSVQIKKPIRKVSPAPRDKTKVTPQKIRKTSKDTTGKGEKRNF